MSTTYYSHVKKYFATELDLQRSQHTNLRRVGSKTEIATVIITLARGDHANEVEFVLVEKS